MYIKLLLIFILSACAHKSGYYKNEGGKWTFVKQRAGFLDYQRVAAPADDSSYQGEELSWPLPSAQKISSHYGQRGSSHHDGIDIPASSGSAIVAAAQGKVIFSGWMRGYGKIVVLKHANNLNTVYAHNSKNLVGKGDRVEQGETVARVGQTGRASGAHLHFEVRKNNRVIDPMKYFSKTTKLAGN